MAIGRDRNSQLSDSRLTQTRIKIRIPKDLHEEPVISRLISHYGLTVNIAAALLGSNSACLCSKSRKSKLYLASKPDD